MSHPAIVCINYSREEREMHIQNLISPNLRQTPKAVDKITFLCPFADNMENTEILYFNCLKIR